MDRMVEDQIIRRGITDPLVIEAMKTVDRSIFVRDSEKGSSYEDTPLPIGFGQTISQPYIVAYMTEQLHLKKNSRVLEIGTGSGYQTAILSFIVDEVYSVETIDELATKAMITMNISGFTNARIKHDDGFNGWKDFSPFDFIIVTAAAPRIPEPLIKQLNDPGRMIIPVGPMFGTQFLVLLEKRNNSIKKTRLIPVRFVPFISKRNF